MALFQLINNVVMTLADSLDPSDTTLRVLDSDLSEAEKYNPTQQLSLTLIGDEELNQYEIVYATSRTGTTFTVLRGREDSVAAMWPAGVKIVAALSAGMLAGIADVPTSADNIGYGGGNFGPSSTVEDAIDDLGDAVIRINASTDYFEDVKERIGGGLFTNVGPCEDNLRWQASAGRIATDGFGIAVTSSIVDIAPLPTAPDVVICVRSTSADKLGSFKVVLYNGTTTTMTWTLLETVFQPHNAWTHIWLGASSAVVVGDPTVTPPNQLRLEVKDDATGVFTVDLNFVDLIDNAKSYIGSFVKVGSVPDFDKVWAIQQFGFQVSLVVKIEDLDAGLVNLAMLRQAEVDGNRIYLTSASDFYNQTQAQIEATLYKGVRLAAEANIRPAGFVYPGLYNGPLALAPTVSIRELVLKAYPRGVGVGSFRSAVQVYTFDGPLTTAATLATAQAYLLGSDQQSINLELSLLTSVELKTLFEGVFESGQYYQARFPWQNADNITSGTIPPSRLPVTPIAKGGTAGTTVTQARVNLGISDEFGNQTIAGNVDIAGYLKAAGNVQGGTNVISKAASAVGNVHFWLYGPGNEDRMVLYAPAAGGHVVLRVAGSQAFTFLNNGQFKAPAHVFAAGAYLNTDGNTVGPNPGSVWLNYGTGNADAYSAITNRIEQRGAAFQAGCVTSTRMAGAIDHTVHNGTPQMGIMYEWSAYVITGFARADADRYIYRYRQPQVHYPAFGWLAAFSF